MPDWATSDGAFLFYVALLAGIVGLATDWVRVWRRQSNLRKELAGIFSGTLATATPSVEDIYRPIIGDDPPTATHYYLAGIDELLQPGVLDPRNEADLVLELMYLRGNVDSYNRNAELYNLTWVFGVDSKKLHGAKIGKYMSHKDLVEASDNLRSMIESSEWGLEYQCQAKRPIRSSTGKRTRSGSGSAEGDCASPALPRSTETAQTFHPARSHSHTPSRHTPANRTTWVKHNISQQL